MLSLAVQDSGGGAFWEVIQPTDATSFWAMVAGLASVALVLAVMRGLRSLKLTQADVELRTKREASALAVARCEEFALEIIPEGVHIDGALKAAQIPRFVTSVATVTFNPDNTQLLAAAEEWRSPIGADLDWRCISLLNRLEAWAMHFATGVADHSVAFGPCAQVFCNMVVRHYPFLLQARANPSSGNFPYTVKLFENWNDQLEKEHLGLKAEDLMKKLDSIAERASKTVEALPDPTMGTKLD